MTDDTHELQKLLSEQSQRIQALTKEKKELEEVLRGFCHAVRKSDEKYIDWVGTSEVYDALFKSESLLSKSKFEVPNQS